MSKTNIRITCAQIQSITNEKEKNIQKMKSYVDCAMEAYPDTDLILFPEYALTGCECTRDEIKEIAETLDGDSICEMAAYARQKKIHIVFGFLEKEADPHVIYNSCVLISNQGEVLGQYRKMHLVEEEKVLVAPGNSDYPVFDTSIGKIGMLICWDSAFVETARILALKGADYLLIPAAWETPQQKDWDLVQRARAFDNVIFTACCNQVGQDRSLHFFGQSKVHGPTGEILSDVVENAEAIVSATFDYTTKQSLRDGYYALLNDRRPETYGAILFSIK